MDPLKLATRSLTVLDLARALDQENRDYSAGDFDEGKRSYVVRTTGEYQSPEDVATVIIARRDGAPVYVQDVATVSVAYQEPSHVVREMGRNSIAVNAIRETGANTLNTMEQLRTAVRELNDEILQRRGFKLFQVYDETDYIYSSIDLVQTNPGHRRHPCRDGPLPVPAHGEHDLRRRFGYSHQHHGHLHFPVGTGPKRERDQSRRDDAGRGHAGRQFHRRPGKHLPSPGVGQTVAASRL